SLRRRPDHLYGLHTSARFASASVRVPELPPMARLLRIFSRAGRSDRFLAISKSALVSAALSAHGSAAIYSTLPVPTPGPSPSALSASLFSLSRATHASTASRVNCLNIRSRQGFELASVWPTLH